MIEAEVSPRAFGKPKPYIPTIVGYLLVKNILGNASHERLANLAAAPYEVLGDESAQHRERLRKSLRAFFGNERTVRPKTKERLVAEIVNGSHHEIRLIFGKDIAGAALAIERLQDSSVPFWALVPSVMQFLPANKCHYDFLALCHKMDKFGEQFCVLANANEFIAAKNLLLDTTWLDDDYWILPDLNTSSPYENRSRVAHAVNWEELRTAAMPISLNMGLSWGAYLGMAAFTGAEISGLDLPLFLPLLSKRRDNGKRKKSLQSAALYQRPVVSLVNMVEVLATHARGLSKPADKYAPLFDQTAMKNQLKNFKKMSNMTDAQFERLVVTCWPSKKIEFDRLCGFSIQTLHIATELFCILIGADRKTSKADLTEVSSDMDFTYGALRRNYLRWWQKHRMSLGRGREERPLPVWFTTLFGGIG